MASGGPPIGRGRDGSGVAVRPFAGDAGVDPLQFDDELVDLLHELFPAGVRAACDQFGGVLGQRLLARLPGPAPHLAIGQQGQPAHVAAAAGVLQIAQKVFESGQQECVGGVHVAVQHIPVCGYWLAHSSAGGSHVAKCYDVRHFYTQREDPAWPMTISRQPSGWRAVRLVRCTNPGSWTSASPARAARISASGSSTCCCPSSRSRCPCRLPARGAWPISKTTPWWAATRWAFTPTRGRCSAATCWCWCLAWGIGRCRISCRRSPGRPEVRLPDPVAVLPAGAGLRVVPAQSAGWRRGGPRSDPAGADDRGRGRARFPGCAALADGAHQALPAWGLRLRAGARRAHRGGRPFLRAVLQGAGGDPADLAARRRGGGGGGGGLPGLWWAPVGGG